MVRPANFDYSGLGQALAGTTAVIVDQVVNRRAWKQPSGVATTGNVTIATALNAGDTIDGVTLAAGDRVLVWQQTAPAENGIYIVDAAPFRAADFDASDEIVGAFVAITAGTTYAGHLFHNTNTAAVVVDTDDITFEEFSGAGAASTPFDHGAMGATETLNLADGNWHRGTLNADCTITVAGFTADEATEMVVELAQDGTGGWAITWDADVTFIGSDQPGLTAGDVTFFLLWTSQGDSLIYGAKIGSGGLTVKDEGTPLATLAESLDFVGAGVAASGTGTAKTITIAGVTEAAVRDVGHWEVVVSGTAPPVAVSTPADDDWVYAWVAG